MDWKGFDEYRIKNYEYLKNLCNGKALYYELMADRTRLRRPFFLLAARLSHRNARKYERLANNVRRIHQELYG